MDDATLHFVYAFCLSTAAGLATCLGGAVVFCTRLLKYANKEFLAGGMAIAGGVMVFVTFVDIYQKSIIGFDKEITCVVTTANATVCLNSRKEVVSDDSESRPAHIGTLYATLSFFTGIILMKIQDALVHSCFHHQCHHHHEDAKMLEVKVTEDDVSDTPVPPEHQSTPCVSRRGSYMEGEGEIVAEVAEMKKDGLTDESILECGKDQRLVRVGIATTIAIFLHNFPEGAATFVAALPGEGDGIALAFAIGIHNIPEGVCAAVPIMYGTGSAWKGFLYASLSGLSEPIGAGFAWILIQAFDQLDSDQFNAVGNDIFGAAFGVVGGMMAFIVFGEILPVARRYDPTDRMTTNLFCVGMFVMAISIWAIEFGQT